LEKSNPTGSEMKEQQYINQNIQSVTIGKRSVSAPANNGEKSSIPPVSPDTRRKSSKTRGREHRKRHAKKRPPTTGSDILGGIPVPKEAGPRGGIRTQVHRYKDPFEEIVQPIFGKADSDSDGYLSTEEFWKIFRSQQLNLALTDEELGQLENEADLDKDGKISYEECIPVLRKVLMAVYQIQDKSPFEWIELATEDGSSLWFSKSTGETRYTPPEGYGTTHQPDLFEEVIYEVFLAADTRQIGYLSRDQLIQLLQSESLALHLTEEEVIAITQELPGYAEGRVTYDEFVPVAKQLIMMSYQARDPSMSEWIQLNSSQFGLFWFNKRTGETRNQPPQELVMLQQQLQEQREEEIAFVHQTMEELEATKYVYEQEQIRSEALESDLAQMAQQLDETGRALDEANEQKAQYNAELNAKTAELAELNSLIQDLKVQITALSPLPDELQNVKLSLHVAEYAYVLELTTL
jgi:Ca2+-binding EF-hand superfamily protein